MKIKTDKLLKLPEEKDEKNVNFRFGSYALGWNKCLAQVKKDNEFFEIDSQEIVNIIKTTNIDIDGQKALDRGQAVVICMTDIIKISVAIAESHSTWLKRGE